MRRKPPVFKSISLSHTPDKWRGRSPALGGSSESRHLQLGRLPVDRLARILDRALEGLPGLADDLLVCGDGTLRGHAQGVGLERHVGGELSLALGGAVEADGSIDIFICQSNDHMLTCHRHNHDCRNGRLA